MLFLTLISCTKDDAVLDSGDAAFAPTSDAMGSGTLAVGAGVASITPTCFESWVDTGDMNAELDDGEEFLDCGCDRLCDGDDGYPGPDEGEGDGVFQAVWMAGFQNNRPAQGVRDDLSARAVIFEQGDVRVGVVVLDLVGWMNPEVEETREAAAALDLDHVTILSTHTHEGPDTLGLWGKTETKSGYTKDYRAYVVGQTVEALTLASDDVREVGTFTVGSVDAASYAEIGILNVLQDKRDPKCVDTALNAAWFQDTSGETIVSLSHFGNHPEAMADENGLITADYVWALRDALENGVVYDSYTREGLGGTSIFLTANVGGMMTPLGITNTDGDGIERREYTFEKTDAIGKTKAEMALDAIENGQVVTDAGVAFAQSRFSLPVDNYGFQAMFLTGIIDREIFEWDPAEPIDEDNTPVVYTEIDLIRVGPIEMLTIPGEVLPELAVGGYDGSKIGTTYDDVISDDNLNPPDLSLAPEGPFWKEKVPGEHVWILNLANDELGYIIPPYDFELDAAQPWFEEPEGDHYEETNSLGPQTAPLLDERIDELLGWVDANQR
ncbi:MAG: hypothetical protein GY913_14520 [Proteobacteria bacterium]|nr:hypothetical protein [Pseudomonadota bacterium]